MESQFSRRAVATVIAAGLVLTVSHAKASTQAGDDAISKMVGSWRLNTTLSTASNGGRRGSGAPGGAPSGGGGGGRRGGGGGGGGGASDSPAAIEQAAQIRALRQSATQTEVVVTVSGTAAEITFTDLKGNAQSYTTDGKKQLIGVGEVKVNAKTKWDKSKLKQDITVGDLAYTRTWEITAEGKLLITIRLNAGEADDNTKPALFYYDRQ